MGRCNKPSNIGHQTSKQLEIKHQTSKQLEMLLRGETNFSVCTLFSPLIFLIKNVVKNQNLRITSQVFCKNLRNQRTLRYQKNYTYRSNYSTEISDVKTRHKNN